MPPRGGSWIAPGGGTRPSHGVASSQKPVARGQRPTPEALKRVARGREAHPGKRRKRSPTLEGLQQGVGIFAPPSGCVLINTQEPRVGAVAPTRGYRLQRLRRAGGRAGQGIILRTCIPHPPSPQRGARRQPKGGAERNPGSPHPMTPRPNGANGDQTHPVPCALSGHGGLCVAWSPGFHPVLAFTCRPFGA